MYNGYMEEMVFHFFLCHTFISHQKIIYIADSSKALACGTTEFWIREHDYKFCNGQLLGVMNRFHHHYKKDVCLRDR